MIQKISQRSVTRPGV